MIVRIASGLTRELHRLAADGGQDEVCGLVLGQTSETLAEVVAEILEVRPARNVAADPRRRFEIDPAMLLATHREARGLGMEVLGHYHSHPAGSARPSPRDAARALEDGQLWFIIAGGDLAVWLAVSEQPDALHGRFSPMKLEVR